MCHIHYILHCHIHYILHVPHTLQYTTEHWASCYFACATYTTIHYGTLSQLLFCMCHIHYSTLQNTEPAVILHVPHTLHFACATYTIFCMCHIHYNTLQYTEPAVILHMYLACITIRAKCVYCVIVRVSFVLKLILNSMFCDAVIIMYTRLLLLCAHGCYYYVHTVVIPLMKIRDSSVSTVA